MEAVCNWSITSGRCGGISEWPSWGLGRGGEWYLRHSKEEAPEVPFRGGPGMIRQAAWTSRFKCLHYLTVLWGSRWRTVLKLTYTLHPWIILHKAELAGSKFRTKCVVITGLKKWDRRCLLQEHVVLKLDVRKPGFFLWKSFGQGERNRERSPNSGWMIKATDKKPCLETRLQEGVRPSGHQRLKVPCLMEEQELM